MILMVIIVETEMWLTGDNQIPDIRKFLRFYLHVHLAQTLTKIKRIPCKHSQAPLPVSFRPARSCQVSA